jgi:hypothetical protein
VSGVVIWMYLSFEFQIGPRIASEHPRRSLDCQAAVI